MCKYMPALDNCNYAKFLSTANDDDDDPFQEDMLDVPDSVLLEAYDQTAATSKRQKVDGDSD